MSSKNGKLFLNENELLNRYQGSLIGMAIGDAYGTTYEFVPREGVDLNHLLKNDFMAGGPFKLMEGMFTDDTSLALVHAESLLDFYSIEENNTVLSKLKSFYLDDRQENEFEKINEKTTCIRGSDINQKAMNWYQNGHFSANGRCFDIGMTTRTYLFKISKEGSEFCQKSDVNDKASGNGALMRLSPVPLYFYALYLRALKEKNKDVDSYLLHRVIEESGFSSMTTHPSEMSIDCNRYMAALLIGCLQGATKEQLLTGLFVPNGLPVDYWVKYPLRAEVFNVADNFAIRYKNTKSSDIFNSGFSVKSLEAALWAFNKYDNFMDALMNITALGDDSDTIAAIYGQLAGCYYGLKGIQQQNASVLVEKCVYSKFICLIASELLKAPMTYNGNSWSYTNIMRIFYLLEEEYHEIDTRVLPSPKQFKNITDFDSSVQNMIQKYEQLNNKIRESMKDIPKNEVDDFTTVSDSLIKDFLKRCEKYIRPNFENELKTKKGQASLFASLKKNQNE